MTALGADPDRLDQIAAQLDQLSGDIDHRRLTLGAWIEGDRFWRGPAADEFRHAWGSTYFPALGAAAQFLKDCRDSLHDNANQQRVASGESPKSHGGGFLSHLFHEAEHAIAGAAKAEVSGLERIGKWTVQTVETAERDLNSFVSSDAFRDVLDVMRTVGPLLSTIGLIPIPPLEIVGAFGLAISAATLLGDSIYMANTNQLDAGKLAGDSLGLFAGAAGVIAGGARDAMLAAPTVKTVTAYISVAQKANIWTAANDTYHAATTVSAVQNDLNRGETRAALFDAAAGGASIATSSPQAGAGVQAVNNLAETVDGGQETSNDGGQQ